MERDKEILKILERLDASVNKGNETYQNLFDFHKVSEDSTKKSRNGISNQLDVIVKELKSSNASKTKNTKILNGISRTLKEVPSILTGIKRSIEVQTSVLGSMIGAMSGQGDSVSSLKGFEKQSSDASIGKLDKIFKGANKNINSPAEAKSKATQDVTVGGMKPTEIKIMTDGLKNMGQLLLGFVSALKSYSKIQDKIDAEGLVNNVVTIIDKISNVLLHKKLPKKGINKTLMIIAKGLVNFITEIADVKKSKVNRFSKITDALSKSFDRILALLDKITAKPKRYDSAVEVFGMIIKSIRKMQVGFLFAALLFPLLPFALVSFAAMFKIAYGVGWFGMFGVRKIMANGAATLLTLSNSILRMSLSFWILGRIMKKYDVQGILNTIMSSFELFEKVSDMTIDYKKVNKNLSVFGSFLSILTSSFVNFDTIFTILKAYKLPTITADIEKISVLVRESLRLFGVFSNLTFNGKKAYKNIEGLEIFIGSIPRLILKIGEVSNIVVKMKLDERAKEIKKIMTPIMALLDMMMIKNAPKLSEILKLKLAFSTALKSINTIINSLGIIKEDKIKGVTAKVKAIEGIFKKVFALFTEMHDHADVISKSRKTSEYMLNISKNGLKMVMMLALITPFAPIALIGLTFIITAINMLKQVSKNSLKLQKFAMALMSLTPAILMFSVGLLVASLLLSKVDWKSIIVGFAAIFIITAMFEDVGKQFKKILRGSLALGAISLSLILFGFSMSIYSLAISTVNIGSALLGSILIIAYGIAFELVGAGMVEILKGSLAVLVMGVGLLAFSVGLLAYAAAVQIAGIGSLLMGSIVLLAYATVFTLIGIAIVAAVGAPLLGPVMAILMGVALTLFSAGLTAYGIVLNTISIGSVLLGAGVLMAYSIAFSMASMGIIGAPSVMLMGVALLLFSPGLLALSTIMGVVDIKQVLFGAAIIAGMGIAFGIVGLGSIFIIPGALAVALMGLSLIPFSLGLAALSLLPKMDPMNFLIVGATIVLFGMGYAFIGLFSPFIFLGALAILGISFTLPLFVASLYSLKILDDIEWSSIGKLGLLMAGLGVGYAALGVVSPFIFGGILAVTGMSLSLKALTMALKDAMTLDWKKVPIDDIASVLLKLTTAFALVGSDGNTGIGGFLTGMMNAVGIGPNNVKRGVETVKEAGKALVSISEGLLEFNTKIKQLDLSVDENGLAKSGSFLSKMSASIMAVSEAFGAMGVKYPSKSFFGLWTLDKSAIQKGIEATFESGRALNSVAEGLFQFDAKTKDLFGNDGGATLLNSISKTIGMISASFSGIALEEESIFGITITKSNVQKGIDSVKDVGKIFTGIAEGLKTWSDLDRAGINVSKIGDNISTVLKMISKQFGDIGEKSDSGFLGMGIFTSTNVEKGIKSVEGIGKVFSEITEGLKSFASLEKMGFKPDSFNPNTKGSIASNMLDVIKATSDIFGKIGEKGKYIETTDKYGNKTKVWVYDESVKRGIDSVKGVGDILNGIGNSLKSFASIDSMKMTEVRSNITDILTTISVIFSEIGSGKLNVTKTEDVAAGIKAVSGVGKELESISKSLQPYMDLQKDKKIDIDVIKKNIKDIISTTLIMLGSIGLIQNGNNADKAFLEAQFGNSYWVMRTQNIKAGSDALKAGTDGMDFIQKAGDVLKKYSEDANKINFGNISSQIRDVIVTALTPLGALGLIQSDDPKNMEAAQAFYGKNAWLLNNYWLDKGKNVIGNIKDSINGIISIANLLNNKDFNTEGWDAKKATMSDIIKSPIFAIGDIVQKYGYDTIVKWLNELVPSITKSIDNILTVAQRTYNGSIGMLTGDVKEFIKDVVNAKFNNKSLESMDKIVQFFERWSKIEDPFSRFAKTFKQHLGDFKEYVKEINNIDVNRMNTFSDLNYKITELVKLDPTQVATNAESVKNLISKVSESIKNSKPESNATNTNVFNSNNTQELENSLKELVMLTKNQQSKNDSKMDNTLNDSVIGLRQDMQKLISMFNDGSARTTVKQSGGRR